MPYTPKKVCLNPHTTLLNSIPSTEPGRSKYVFIETQSFQTLYPLPNLVG